MPDSHQQGETPEEGQQLLQAWQESEHADYLDARAGYNLRDLRVIYENFNEFRLFLDQRDNLIGRDFLEIGCATGELYRYLQGYHSDFDYHGYDISRPGIERARKKYPSGQFDLCRPDVSDLIESDITSSVVFARDVVLHQPEPFTYLSRLLSLSKEISILRLRTRDRGDTVLDAELSCQWHYNQWVPYFVLNIDELVETIARTVPTKRIILVKRYVQLGGWHRRFLPKECYYPETGTAETAVCIVRSDKTEGDPEIVVSEREDTELPPLPLWKRGLRHLAWKLSRDR
jgi:SAM-dependent methyltransferase